MNTQKEISEFIEYLNKKYARLHKSYEDNFWKSYMGQPKYDQPMNKALTKRDEFRSNPKYLDKVQKFLASAKGSQKQSLENWERFFSLHQTPKEALVLRQKIADVENSIAEKRNFYNEGYIDPYTKKFVPMSKLKMRTAIATENDEKIRKAYFKGMEEIATSFTDEYMELVSLRNAYAQKLGYTDFYAYKVELQDRMTKDELFSIFEHIYQKTKYAFADIRKLEKKKPGLRKPWNYHYMMAGDFTKKEDPYFQLEYALPYWGQTFQNLGINMDGGSITLDLIDRKGKYNNGFCHWPKLVQFEGNKKIPGSSNFTCNAVVGQTGAGKIAMNTLFHEGGHAAHMLNSQQKDTCMNTEFLPMTASWAETQSMFCDTIFSSAEWKTRYAKDRNGNQYPFELIEESIKKFNITRPLYMMGIYSVMSFEREIYETKNLTKNKILQIADRNSKKFFDRSEKTYWLLSVPHIYSFESSCSYHGYGLAAIAVAQWRDYFYKKYGYIVDNPNIGKEMKKVWKDAATKTFPEFVQQATGKKITPTPFLKSITGTATSKIRLTKKRIVDLEKIKKKTKPINLKANITLVHGTKKICDNNISFEDMADKYANWLTKQK